MRHKKKWLCLLLILGLLAGLTGCGNEGPQEEASVLRVGVGAKEFDGKFSPFFAESVADQTAMELTQIRLLTSDRAGLPVLQGMEGETRPYNDTDYTYYGPADLTMTENADGTVFYDITLREDLVFSDGEPVTIDDLIFSLYVLCDPAYNGTNRLREMPIQGLKDYRLNNISLSALLAQLGEDNTDFSKVTQEQQTAFWAVVDEVLTPLVQNLVEQHQAIYDANRDEKDETERVIYTPAKVARDYGWGELPEDATARDAALAMGEYFNWDFMRMDSWFSDSYFPVTDLAEQLGEVYDYSSETITSGQNATEISGIQKTGDYSLRVVADELNVSTLYYLGSVYIAPLHYYGDQTTFDAQQNSFGFQKGDLEKVRSLNEQPMGAGPYRLVSYQNGAVSYEANEHYYQGNPKTQKLNLEIQNVTQQLETGKLDFCYLPSGASYWVERENIAVIPVWLLESTNYQYIGLNPQTVNVAGEPGSEASKNLRKGIATVLAACRQLSVDEIVTKSIEEDADNGGHNTEVIDYPVSSLCWLVPGRNDPAYEEAFARDVNGQAIDTENMTEEERLKAAGQAALGYFAAAGYTIENGVLTAPPEGASLTYEAKIFCASTDPILLTLQTASEQLAKLGMDLVVINTFDDPDQPYPKPGASDLWADGWDGTDLGGVFKEGDQWEEWYLVTDPEVFLFPVFYCDTANGGTNAGSRSDVFQLDDPELDQLLLEAHSTVDQTQRQELYRQCMDRIMDWACEVPCYQDHGNLAYHTQRLNADTLPSDMTGHYGWLQEIYHLELLAEE